MALTKIGIDAVEGAIGTTQLENNAVTSAKIAAGAVGTTDIADSAVTTAKTGFSSETGAIIPPKGTTAQRPESPILGQVRFNTTTDCLEQYTSLGWAGIAAPPVITTISPTSFNGETGSTITINGANFQSGITATFITNAGTAYAAAVTTLINSSQITATTPQDFTVADEPIDVKVTNANGLSTTLADALDCGGSPTWTTAAGSIGTFYDSQRTISTSISATDPDAGGTIASYSITTGSLPTGLSLNGSTGAITGTANAVGSDTTSSFTIRATDNAGNTSDRAFSMTIKAPVITTYTTVGSGTFSVPSGVSAVRVLVIAGGGGGGGNNSGGGGAGGMIEHPSFPVTPGGSVSYTLGAGGARGDANSNAGSNGSNSVFGTLTAVGGGGSDYWTQFRTANSGGSGAGGSGNPGYRAAGGTGTQPSQPGASGTYGFGFPGGQGGHATGDAGGGGGGGAGGAGVDNQAFPGSSVYPGSGSAGGHGGLAKVSTITGSPVYYAGGGGGGSGGAGSGPYWPGAEPPGGIGGIGGPYTNPYAASPLGGGGNGGSSQGNIAANPGGTNTGGGGGGGDNTNGGTGGPGVIIVRY